MIDFVERRFIYLFISLAMLVVAIASLALFGIKPGIELLANTVRGMGPVEIGRAHV